MQNTAYVMTMEEANCTKPYHDENIEDYIKRCSSYINQDSMIFQKIFSAILIALGLSGCLLIIFAVLRNKQMRSSRGNILIMNLAISDAILCSITIPFLMYSVQSWIFGRFLCRILSIFPAFNVYVATLSITAISLDRFQAIVYPKTKNFLNNFRLSYLIAGIWMISFLLASPLYYARDIHNDSEGTICISVFDKRTVFWMMIYGISEMIFQYLFPLIILTFTYARIVLRMKHFERLFGDRHYPNDLMNNILSQQQQKEHNEPEESHVEGQKCVNTDTETGRLLPLNRIWKRPNTKKKNLKYMSFNKRRKRQRTIVLLISLAFIFAISWLPIHISSIIMDYQTLYADKVAGSNVVLDVLIKFQTLLVLTSSCLNPILYGWLNENFRNEFISIFRDIFVSKCSSNDKVNQSDDINNGKDQTKLTKLQRINEVSQKNPLAIKQMEEKKYPDYDDEETSDDGIQDI